MKSNVGSQDRVARIVAGVILIGFALISGNIIGWIGVVPLITGIIGYCPAYPLLGMDTAHKSEHGETGH